MLTTFTQEVWGAKTLAITSSRPTYSAITGKAIAMSEQSNDSNTSFKDELEKILDQYYAPIKLPDNNRTALITSIINLVDKVIGEDEERKVEDWDCPCGTNHHLETDYHQRNALRAEQRAIIRGNDA